MITAVFVFITTVVAIIVCLIYSLRWLALFFFILLSLIIIRKALQESKKYGRYSFLEIFKKSPECNRQMDLVEHIVKKNNGLHLTFVYGETTLVCVSSSGVYLIEVLDYSGNILGNESDPTLILKNETHSSISNFFSDCSRIEKQIKAIYPAVEIHKMIVKKNTCMVLSSYSREYQILGVHNLYYQLQKLEKVKLYTEEQVKEMTTSIQEMLSKTVKF